MKFGKRLQASLVPEWRDQFINYKKLKKYIFNYCSKDKKHKKKGIRSKIKQVAEIVEKHTKPAEELQLAQEVEKKHTDLQRKNNNAGNGPITSSTSASPSFLANSTISLAPVPGAPVTPPSASYYDGVQVTLPRSTFHSRVPSNSTTFSAAEIPFATITSSSGASVASSSNNNNFIQQLPESQAAAAALANNNNNNNSTPGTYNPYNYNPTEEIPPDIDIGSDAHMGDPLHEAEFQRAQALGLPVPSGPKEAALDGTKGMHLTIAPSLMLSPDHNLEECHIIFRQMLEEEIEKVDKFYQKMETKYEKRHNDLVRQIEQMRNVTNVTRRTKQTLQLAFQEHYASFFFCFCFFNLDSHFFCYPFSNNSAP